MVEKRRQNENGVIINIYKESRILRSDHKTDRINLTRIWPRVIRTRGYNRHAQLLSYAQELKHANGETVNRPLKNSSQKLKKPRLATIGERIRRLFLRFQRVKRLWKYESINREDYCHGEEKWSYGRRKRFHFCKKLKYLLKKISGAWKCKNGAIN